MLAQNLGYIQLISEAIITARPKTSSFRWARNNTPYATINVIHQALAAVSLCLIGMLRILSQTFDMKDLPLRSNIAGSPGSFPHPAR